MRYYLDCEFNGLGGELLSLALVRQDGNSYYTVFEPLLDIDPWVRANVMPILWEAPGCRLRTREEAQAGIAAFLRGDKQPLIISDWPDDIKYFCELAITGPGTMIDVPRLGFQVHRVDAYPTTLPGAIQHNAWWDAMALRHLLSSPPEHLP